MRNPVLLLKAEAVTKISTVYEEVVES